MKKSIVTSFYNRKPGTLEVIDRMFFPSLINNADSDTEVIIIDDCSPLEKETKELVEKYLPRLKKFRRVVFKRNSQNLGFAGSFNRGIKLASGKRLLIVNNDVYLPKGSVSSLLETLSEDPNTGLAGPITNEHMVYTPQYCKQAPRIVEYSPKEFAKIEDFAKRARKLMRGERIKTDWVCGFCMAANAAKLKEMRGFDEQFKYGLCEDLDLGKRMSQKYSVVINPEVFVYHGGIYGSHVTARQQPLRTAYHFIVNSYKEGKASGFFPVILTNIKGLIRSTGIGTVSGLFEAKSREENQ